jgi:hypothetical protein
MAQANGKGKIGANVFKTRKKLTWQLCQGAGAGGAQNISVKNHQAERHLAYSDQTSASWRNVVSANCFSARI